MVGTTEGNRDGASVGEVGYCVSNGALEISVGLREGILLGPTDGTTLGSTEGTLLGNSVGTIEGTMDGLIEGNNEGPGDGISVGTVVACGTLEGDKVITSLGLTEGYNVDDIVGLEVGV